MAAIRGWSLYCLALAATVTMLVAFVPAGEDALADVGPRPHAELVEVTDLEIDAAGGLPALRAGRAAPKDPSGPIALAGAVSGLVLERVIVTLSVGVELVAETGELVGDRLTLHRAHVGEPGRESLIAEVVEFYGGLARFPGLVVWFRGTARERVERDVTVGLDALTASLSGR